MNSQSNSQIQDKSVAISSEKTSPSRIKVHQPDKDNYDSDKWGDSKSQICLFGILYLSIEFAVVDSRILEFSDSERLKNIIPHKKKPILNTDERMAVYTLVAYENAEKRFNLSRIISNRERYVASHPNHFHEYHDKTDHGIIPVWQKVEDFSKFINNYDWTLLLDSTDAFIVNGSISLHDIVYQARKKHSNKDLDIIVSKDCTMINCGSFMVSGSEWSKSMVKYWRALGRYDMDFGGFRNGNFNEQGALNHIIESDWMGAKSRTLIVDQHVLNSYAWNPCGKIYKPGDFIIHEPNNGAQRLLNVMKQKGINEF